MYFMHNESGCSGLNVFLPYSRLNPKTNMMVLGGGFLK